MSLSATFEPTWSLCRWNNRQHKQGVCEVLLVSLSKGHEESLTLMKDRLRQRQLVSLNIVQPVLVS